jgi:hypothetical protein
MSDLVNAAVRLNLARTPRIWLRSDARRVPETVLRDLKRRGSYAVEIRRSAIKELNARQRGPGPRDVADQVSAAAKAGGAEELTGAEQYRVRQACIILYGSLRRTVTIVKVGHRREVYR